MGAMAEMDPRTVRPARGKLLIELVQQLGGVTAGGIVLAGHFQDRHGRDTVYGRVLAMGEPPAVGWGRRGRLPDVPDDTPDPGHGCWRERERPWPDGFLTVSVGDVVLAPRDVPLAFAWRDPTTGRSGRYALVIVHELIAVIEGDPAGFVQIPWDA